MSGSFPASSPRNVMRALLVSLALGSMAACASVPTDADARAEYLAINDPFEPFNRGMFEFNRALDTMLLKPAAQLYRGVIPQAGRDMVENFLDNLRTPVILANDILQGELDRAGDTGGRFMANTLLGAGGLFETTDIEFHNEDFGQTLAVWGMEEGPYLVLPLIGPSPVRDTLGLVGDTLMDPVNWWADDAGHDAVPWVRAGLRAIDTRSRNIETLDEIERSSIDFYATVRNLYRQRRNDEIRNGKPPETVPMPEISLDSDDEPAPATADLASTAIKAN
jgi:phospholipid-binding lipoprotein MlaA